MTRYPKSARLPLTLPWKSTTALNDFYDLGVLAFFRYSTNEPGTFYYGNVTTQMPFATERDNELGVE